MNDICLLGYIKTESLNENKFGLRKKTRKMSLPEYPSRCMRTMNKAVEKHLSPREERGRKKQKSFPLISHLSYEPSLCTDHREMRNPAHQTSFWQFNLSFLNKCSSSTCYVLGTAHSTGDRAISHTNKNASPHEAHTLVRVKSI